MEAPAPGARASGPAFGVELPPGGASAFATAPEERNAAAVGGLLSVEKQKLRLQDEKRSGERLQTPKAYDNSGYFGFCRGVLSNEYSGGSIVPASGRLVGLQTVNNFPVEVAVELEDHNKNDTERGFEFALPERVVVAFSEWSSGRFQLNS